MPSCCQTDCAWASDSSSTNVTGKPPKTRLPVYDACIPKYRPAFGMSVPIRKLKRDYKEAIASFRSLVASAPDSPRAPEALLAIANCQAELKDTKSARRTIDELVKTYPKSEAAAAGRERLASLK